MSMLRSENIARFERYIEQVMEAEHAAGLAVAVISDNGQELYCKCFGLRDQEKGLTVDPDTVFGLASVTKSFTALAVMQLAERGLLQLNDPVCSHLPEFAHRGMTIEHLLSHSAGFYPQPRKLIIPLLESRGYQRESAGDPAYSGSVARAASAELIEALNGQQTLIGPPGEYFSYSNDSYSLLSDLVRRLSGEETFAAYLDKYILSPLGMDSSGCGFEWKGDNVTRLYQTRNGVMAGDWGFYDDASALPGGGAMKSTLNDMKQYLLLYLNQGRTPCGTQVLSRAGIRRMIRPRIACGLNQYYGLGLMIKPLNGLTVIEHGGDMPGISSHMAFTYETGIGVAVLCNTSQVPVALISDMAMQLASGMPADGPQAPDPVEWDSGLMDQVCGLYRSGEGNTIRIRPMDGKFAVNLDGADTVAYPMNNYMLHVKGRAEDLQAAIYRDDKGAVWALGGGYRIIPKVE